MTGHRLIGWRLVAIVAAAATLAGMAAVLLDARTAHAAGPEPTGQLSVTSDRGTRAEFSAFSPGSTQRWRLTATVAGADADLDLMVNRSGGLVERGGGLRLAVETCPGRWTSAGECSAGEATTVVTSTPLGAAVYDSPVPLGTVPGGRPTRILLTFAMPLTEANQTNDALMSQTASVAVDVGAVGAAVAAPPGSDADGGASGAGADGSSGSGSGGVASLGGGGSGWGPGLLAWTGTSAPALRVALVVGGLALVVGAALRAVVARRRPRARPRP